jgi:hypothetical protein
MKMANSHTPERICRLGGKEWHEFSIF